MTEQKQVEARLLRINRLYSVLSKIGEAIIYIHDRGKLYEEACRIVVEDGGFLLAWIGMVEPSTSLVKPVAHCCGKKGSYLSGLTISVKDVPEGRGMTGTAIREGRYVVCNDIENDPRMAPWLEKALSYGYRSTAAFPLHHGGQIIGALNIYCGEPSFFNKEEIAMLERLTENISFATGVIENEEQAKVAKERLLQSNTLLKTISRAQSEFIADIDTQLLFDGLLNDLLALTGSEYGFIGEMFYDTDGSPYLKTHAITNIAWNDESRALYEKYAPALEFRNLNSLFGEVMTTGKPVISNNPATDPRRCGIPEGHPQLNAFLGLPFYSGNNLIGMVGIANRHDGYDEEMVEYLQPFLSTCSNIIAAYRVKKEHKAAMKGLARSEANLADAQRIAHIGSWERNLLTDEVEWSAEVYSIFGVNPDESRLSYKAFLDRIHPEDADFVKKTINEAIKDKKPYYINYRIVSSDGPEKTVNVQGEVESDDTGRAIKSRGAIQDITELKNLEKQLIHSQKMDAVGQLAGGIAHDFNNALTAILGFGKLLIMKRGDDELVKNYTQHIIDAGESAASLVQGVLAVSRKQAIIPRPIDITELVRNIENIILRLIGEDMELKTVLSKEPLIVKADPAQIEQILMNLATNARDAMPDGGVITISTELVKMDEGFVGAIGYGATGTYALLSFADTGMGIDKETRSRIFEPFFTTKEVGKGTGLGLAMVYGIIKQHDGFINVYSEPGQGTIFEIYLPVVEADAAAKDVVEMPVPKGGTETVLLVEDDKMVRAITLKVLEDFGYNVIVAVNGEDAVRKFRKNRDKVQLCITDMVMPKMGGREAYMEMRKIRPDLRVIFMSGYAADKTNGIIEEGLDFISKPVSPTEFLRKIREVLDR